MTSVPEHGFEQVSQLLHSLIKQFPEVGEGIILSDISRLRNEERMWKIGFKILYVVVVQEEETRSRRRPEKR